MKWILLAPLFCLPGSAYAQGEQALSPADQAIIFGGFAAAVAAVFVFLARDAILRKKTEYDSQNLGSKDDREYDKYCSDWTDDYEDLGSRTRGFRERFEGMSKDGKLPDLYGIIGVERDAAPEEIKARYRRLAKEIHPDRSSEKDAKERMAEINTAYEILSDPDQRTEYDRRSANR